MKTHRKHGQRLLAAQRRRNLCKGEVNQQEKRVNRPIRYLSFLIFLNPNQTLAFLFGPPVLRVLRVLQVLQGFVRFCSHDLPEPFRSCRPSADLICARACAQMRFELISHWFCLEMPCNGWPRQELSNIKYRNSVNISTCQSQVDRSICQRLSYW